MKKFVLHTEENRHRAIECIRNLPLEPASEIRIVAHKSKRSLDQNALHWKRLDVIRLHIADSSGQVFSAEELHEFFKEKFMPAKLVEVGGESVKVRRTTTKLNTKEFSEFMEHIDRYCIERMGLYLPQPGVEDVV